VIDYSGVGGIRGEWDNGITYDFSGRLGHNEIQYTLKNTVNPSQGDKSPTSFHPGDLINEEKQLQADFTKEFEVGIASPLLFAFGASYMDESYELVGGDYDSYIDGPYSLPDPWGFCDDTGAPTAAGAAVISNGSTLDCTLPADNGTDPVYKALGVGSNGFPGYSPEFSGKYTRDSYAIYGDLSADVTDALFLQGALRFEDYSDFDSELVWKVAGRYEFSPNFALRGSVGTGFRAPTPGQQGTTNVSTRLPNGFPVATGLFPAGGPIAGALGASPLKPEKSTNYTLGFTSSYDAFTLTVDYYRIDLKDRVNAISTKDVSSTPPAITDPTDPDYDQSAVDAYDNYLSLVGAGVVGAESIGGVFFFANAFDTKTEGVDIVGTYSKSWANGSTTSLTGSVNYNKTEFDGSVGSVFNDEDKYDFINFDPKLRGVFSVTHEIGPLSLLARANYYGESTNSNTGGPNGGLKYQDYGAKVLVDLEGSYQVSEAVKISLGARNAFDEYPDKANLGDNCCGRIYRSGDTVDWQGGYYYVKLLAKF
jgi:iron complex outermembrane receptor protein